MSTLKLFLLGTPQLEINGRSIEIQRRRVLALLAYLAVSDAAQRRDTLATLLWPETGQSQARAALNRHLSELKQVIGEEWLYLERETVALQRTPALYLDVAHFQQQLTDSRPLSADSLTQLTTAVELYRGDFLAGFSLPDSAEFDHWQFFQREGLQQQLATALAQVTQIYSEQGDYALAIPYARRWLALDPLHEPAHCQLMLLYAQAGQHSAAMRQFQECKHLLDEELGVPPAAETIALFETIRTKRLLKANKETGRQGVTELGLPDNDAIASPTHLVSPSLKHNLPSQPTPFIGREQELIDMTRLLDEPACRLLTLVGPGGMGKTRLALAFGEILLQVESQRWHTLAIPSAPMASNIHFPNGIFFVSLTPLGAVEHIVPAIVEALDFQLESGGRQSRSPQQQLLDYLGQKRLLLILDNFEHLLDGVELVAAILQAAPNVHLLVTSRERLHLREEQIYPIGGLTFPHAEIREDAATYAAVQLFVQGARRVEPDFILRGDDIPYLTRICQFVAGMPLGLELAAAWVDMLSLVEIASEIQRSFDFLATNVRNVPERHRSIRAVINASWQRLSLAEQGVLESLAIFRGFSRAAAEEIAGATLRTLVTLVNKSLLQVNRPHNRYDLHELLRQYAAEQLALHPEAESAVRERHSAYYVGLLQQREGMLNGAQQQTALAEIEAELQNVRSAWEWAIVQGQVERLGQAVESLNRFYEWRGRYQEGEVACQAAVTAAIAASAPRLWVRSLTWLAKFKQMLGQPDQANTLFQQCLILLDKPPLDAQETRWERAGVLAELGWLSRDAGEGQVAQQRYEQSLNLYRAINDLRGMAKVLNGLNWVIRDLGAHGTAQQHYQMIQQAEQLVQQSLAICRVIGDRASLADGLNQLGFTLLSLHRVDEALTTLEECLTLYMELGMQGGVVLANIALAQGNLALGQYAQAQVHAQLAFNMAHEIGYHSLVAWSQQCFAVVALVEEAYPQAQHILQENVAIYREEGNRYLLATALALLTYAQRGLKQATQARQSVSEALQISIETWLWIGPPIVFPIIALLLLDRGELERAVELYALASGEYALLRWQVWEDIAGRHIRTAAASLPPAVVAAAQARGQARDCWATARELLDEIAGWS